MQKIDLDAHSVLRFRSNALVRYLLDAGPFDLNHLALLPNIPRGDWVQLAQLIGYSVSGFGDLSYVKRRETEEADRRADKVRDKRDRKKGC